MYSAWILSIKTGAFLFQYFYMHYRYCCFCFFLCRCINIKRVNLFIVNFIYNIYLVMFRNGDNYLDIYVAYSMHGSIFLGLLIQAQYSQVQKESFNYFFSFSFSMLEGCCLVAGIDILCSSLIDHTCIDLTLISKYTLHGNKLFR